MVYISNTFLADGKSEKKVKHYFIAVLHIILGTIATFLTAIIFRTETLALSHKFSGASRWFTFEIASFAPWFLVVGVVAGYVAFSRIGGRSSFWICLVPCGILLVRILTFPASSIFASGVSDGWRYYFAPVRCSSRELLSLADTAIQCQSRLIYFGLCISSIAYSLGALAKYLAIFEFQRPAPEP